MTHSSSVSEKLKQREMRKLERTARRLRSNAKHFATEAEKYTFNNDPRKAMHYIESYSIASLNDSLKFDQNKLEKISLADLNKKAKLKKNYLNTIEELDIINHKCKETKAELLIEKIKSVLGE